MTKVKWGVLGCASFAHNKTIPAMLASPSVELVGVASRTLEKAEAFRSEFKLERVYDGYDAMLADPDIQAIYNPLPNGLHAEWMIKAARMNKHTLCEKPFTSNASEARQVASAVKHAGVYVMEAFMWRLHSQHRRARQAIERGEIGPLRLVRASFSFPLPRKPNVRLSQDLAGGSMMDIGCYPISAARYYYGEEPVLAYAQGTFDPEYGVDMRMVGILEFPRGRALIDCAFDLPYRTELEIVGESGAIRIPRSWLPDTEATLTINNVTERLPAENQYIAEFEHFSQCILSECPPAYSPDDAVRQMMVIDAVRHSMKSGKPEPI